MMDLEWMIIVVGPGNRPEIIMDDDQPMLFFSIDGVRKLMADHILNTFAWWAFNFKTGEVH